MTAGVWIKIQHDEVILPPMYNKVAKTVNLFLCLTEHTWSVPVAAKILVAVAVDMIHGSILS